MSPLARTSRLSRIATTLVVAGALLGLSAYPAAAAGNPIGPNQFFSGLVNGRHSQAIVRVACPGPISHGHPFGNQPLEVIQASPVPGGFTGSAATSIVAYFAPAATAQPVVTFTKYGVKMAIPTSLTLPCSGQGRVVFSPQPFSPTARADMVTVTFENPLA
jgi:hypothetical protein